MFAQADPAPFARVVRVVGEGSLTVPVTKTYAFDELPEALGLVGKRSSRAKVAIAITNGWQGAVESCLVSAIPPDVMCLR